MVSQVHETMKTRMVNVGPVIGATVSEDGQSRWLQLVAGAPGDICIRTREGIVRSSF